jgi:hypothetical protein
VNGTLIVETALAVVAIEPAKGVYLAISKDLADRAKGRRDAAPPKFSTFAELLRVLGHPAAPAAETTAGLAADSTPASPAGSALTGAAGRDPVTGHFLRADGSNRVRDAANGTLS